jgi:hypothetical protein
VIAATAYASRGGVYVEMGQHQRAIEDYNTARWKLGSKMEIGIKSFPLTIATKEQRKPSPVLAFRPLNISGFPGQDRG